MIHNQHYSGIPKVFCQNQKNINTHVLLKAAKILNILKNVPRIISRTQYNSPFLVVISSVLNICERDKQKIKGYLIVGRYNNGH